MIQVVGIVGWCICIKFYTKYFFLMFVTQPQKIYQLMFQKCCYSTSHEMFLIERDVDPAVESSFGFLHYKVITPQKKIGWTDAKLFPTSFVSLIYAHPLGPKSVVMLIFTC